VPTVLTPHVSAARYGSDPGVHVLRLHSISGGCRKHWDSNHRLSLRRVPLPRIGTSRRIISLRSVGLYCEGVFSETNSGKLMILKELHSAVSGKTLSLRQAWRSL
jgi:hypothetical protein